MKAIFVIDLNADSLPVDAYASVYVFGKYRDEQEDDFLAYKRNIPIRPLPLKRKSEVGWYNESQNIKTHELTCYDRGWNDCIDFIEGGENALEEEN